MRRKVVYSKHALDQMVERGTCKEEVEEAIFKGEKIPAKKDRHTYRLNFQFDESWGEKWYHMKQVMPVVKEETNELIVITVYVFYF